MSPAYIGISLGKDCLPASWGVRNGYRATKAQKYMTCPFDLMVSHYDGMVKCIVENFKNFTNPASLAMVNGVLKNTYYNFTFNHEMPYHANLYKIEKWPGGANHFINNNYAHFIARYNNRIKNFRLYLANPNNRITFILFLHNTNILTNNCQKLREALLLRYPNLIYRILVIQGAVPHNYAKTRIIKVIPGPKWPKKVP
jgi:hypothetical protein